MMMPWGERCCVTLGTYLTSMCLSVLFLKMGTIIISRVADSTALGWGKVAMRSKGT